MSRAITCLLLAFAVFPWDVFAQAPDVVVPIATDSRIKTFIYNENDVFSLMTHYGYQANIEFGEDEKVETISVGDRVAFQIIPAGRRLFIRPMEESARTNMTVITNMRSYQFDLKSTESLESSREEIVYVARFFYPGDNEGDSAVQSPHPLTTPGVADAENVMYGSAGATAVAPPHAGVPPSPSFVPPSAPAVAPAPAPVVNVPVTPPVAVKRQRQGYNFMYSVTGSERIAPVKMYDDGRSTYIVFRNIHSWTPRLFELRSDGSEVPLHYRVTGDGVVVIDNVFARITVRNSGEYACMYNDTIVPMEISEK